MASVVTSFAGPLGPFEQEDTGVDNSTMVEELPSCADRWPYELEQLSSAPDLWFRLRPERAWATPVLLRTLEYAAMRVARLYPDVDPLLVGDLSKQGGGDLPPHRSHGDGRSADIGLYGWTQPEEAVYVDGNGFPTLTPRELDPERTWALIESLLDTGNVEHILLGPGHIERLKGWLLSTGRRTAEEVARIFPGEGTVGLWAREGIVRAARNHDEHLHVRVRCSATAPAP